MSKKYRYRVRVVYDAILESDFPDSFSPDDVIANELKEVETQDVLYFGSGFDPEVTVSDVTCTYDDEYELFAANGETANLLVNLKVADNLYCATELEVSYSVDSCDEGGYNLEVHKFDIVEADFSDVEGREVDINVDIKPLIDSVKISDCIQKWLDRGVH